MPQRRRVTGSSAGMRRVALPAAAAVLAMLVVVATLWPVPAGGDVTVASGPVSSGSYSPALAFADTEHSVLPMSGLMHSGLDAEPDTARPGYSAGLVATWEHLFFGVLEMEERPGADLDLAFAVEAQPDRSLFKFCRRSKQCHDLELRVNSRGLLYLRNPDEARFGGLHHSAGFPQQRLEVSASDTDTGMKVYREVLINPPQEEPGCEDYDDFSVDAYVCLFLRQRIPEGATGSASESTLRAGLPRLVQDKSNYELVFAEEFNGTPPEPNAAGCSDGLTLVNDDVWNYVDTCGYTDSRGEACSNVADGTFQATSSYLCGTNLNTIGKLHYQYGYLEFKYTLNVDNWNWSQNYNFVAWAAAYPEQHLWSQYGVTINSWEDYVKYSSVELDFLEYSPSTQHSSLGMHANWGGSISSSVRGHRTGKRIDYCTQTAPPNRPWWLFMVNTETCSNTDTFTVTKGIEWTPRGYRVHVSWDGIQNDLTVWPANKIEIWERTGGSERLITGAARNRYFEYVDPDDTGTILEQVGISHTPNPLGIGAFGDNLPSTMNYTRTRVKFDYIRLWQPQNHYSDMEPVYQ